MRVLQRAVLGKEGPENWGFVTPYISPATWEGVEGWGWGGCVYYK